MKKYNLKSGFIFVTAVVLFILLGNFNAPVTAEGLEWHIRNDTTGGDCSVIGNWDVLTKTCTLGQDLNKGVVIDSDDITLDGNNHMLVGDTTYDTKGIYLDQKTGVTIRNITTSYFQYGILSQLSQNNIFTNNIALNNSFGIFLDDSDNNVLEKNATFGNSVGIVLYTFSDGNTLADNTVASSSLGIYLQSSSNNNLHNNTISNNGSFGGVDLSLADNNKIYNNNFVSNEKQINYRSGFDNLFNLNTPIGGNYYSDFDTPAEGCTNFNDDNFCDSPYIFSGGQDGSPWTKQDGWLAPSSHWPSLSRLEQFDGATSISEGWTLRQPYISSFNANASDPDGDQVQLQVELRRFEEPFTGIDDGGMLTSDLVSSGEDCRIPAMRDGVRPPIQLSDGKYHWRARAIDSHGNKSGWQEFGVAGNVDFEILTNQSPTISYSQDLDYVDDGVNPDVGYSDTNFTFKIVYTDTDNDAPTRIRVAVFDDRLSGSPAVEVFSDVMTLDSSAHATLRDGNYTNGEQYALTKSFPVGVYRYRWEWSDGKSPCGSSCYAISDGIAIGKEQRFEVIARVKVKIDIKPDSFPNSINLKSRGVIPVAVFGTSEFHVNSIDTVTVTLSGAPIKLAASGKPLFSIKDVDGDGIVDLVAHMNSDDLRLNSSDTTATLVGKTLGGIAIYGIDSIKIVP